MLVYNSQLTANTTAFWNFSYAERFSRRGEPRPDRNFYAGDLYLAGTQFLDRITDLSGTSKVALYAQAVGIDPGTMRFLSPSLVYGVRKIYDLQFAGGWSSADFDGDLHPGLNCSVYFSSVAQHYGDCWGYSLGSDADEPLLDGGAGPHVTREILMELGLSHDGTEYSRVRSISRFVRW